MAPESYSYIDFWFFVIVHSMPFLVFVIIGIFRLRYLNFEKLSIYCLNIFGKYLMVQHAYSEFSFLLEKEQ